MSVKTRIIELAQVNGDSALPHLMHLVRQSNDDVLFQVCHSLGFQLNDYSGYNDCLKIEQALMNTFGPALMSATRISLRDYVPSFAWTAKIWNPPYMGANITLFDTMNGTQCSFYHPASKTWRTRVNQGGGNSWSGWTFNGRGEISPLVPNAGLPKYLLDILSDSIELVPTKMQDWLNKSWDKTFVVPDDAAYASKLLSLDIHFSDTPQTPMAFLNPKTLLEQMDLTDTQRSFSAIKIKKNKGEYSIEQITLADYVENPTSYIAVFKLPKQVSATSRHAVGLVAYMPTLIVPHTFVTTASETVKATFGVFLTALAGHNLDPVLQKDRYQAILAAYPQLTEYWDGVIQIAGSDAMKLKDIVAVTKRPLFAMQTGNQADLLAGNSVLHRIVTSRDYQELSNDLLVQRDLQTQSAKSRSDYDSLSRDVNTLKSQIEALRQQMTATEDRKVTNEHLLTKVQTTFSELDQKQRALQAQVHDRRVAATAIPLEVDPDFNRTVVYTKAQVGRFESYPRPTLMDSMELSFANNYMAIRDHLLNGWVLTSLNAITAKPSIVAVDVADKPIEECSKVVGGPYSIRLNYNPVNNALAGAIFLRSISGVFGIKQITDQVLELKQHPHSQPYRLTRGDAQRIQDFLSAPTKMCFGEAEPVLAKAMRRGDLETVRIVLDRWITSAWSADQWGSQWSWFPSVEKVNLLKANT